MPTWRFRPRRVLCHPHPQHGGTMLNKVVTNHGARATRAWPGDCPIQLPGSGRKRRRVRRRQRGKLRSAGRSGVGTAGTSQTPICGWAGFHLVPTSPCARPRNSRYASSSPLLRPSNVTVSISSSLRTARGWSFKAMRMMWSRLRRSIPGRKIWISRPTWSSWRAPVIFFHRRLMDLRGPDQEPRPAQSSLTPYRTGPSQAPRFHHGACFRPARTLSAAG